MYDYLIVGAGLFGATMARDLTDAGRRVLVIDRRAHIAGNCYTESVEGITVHRYGGHIFHTNSRPVWEYVNRFVPFYPYRHRLAVNHGGRLYSFPINLMTLHQLYGVTTPDEARELIEQVRGPAGGDNLRDWLIGQVGERIYRMFVEGYTRKQWGRDPAELPASIIRRLPIRYSYDDGYFSDIYQGLPSGGYTALVAAMLAGIETRLGVDYLDGRWALDRLAHRTVYTGEIDALFDRDAGALEYRSLRFEWETLPTDDYQGAATINYTDADVPYTRVVEFKHFMPRPPQGVTVIMREYPQAWQPGAEPFYPINDAANNARAAEYQARAKAAGYLYGGRLADYRYYDMHQVIASARTMAQRELEHGAVYA